VVRDTVSQFVFDSLARSDRIPTDAVDESAESDAMSAILSEEVLVQRLSQHAVAIELIKDTDNAILFSHLCKSWSK
jgi:hypothetical protein